MIRELYKNLAKIKPESEKISPEVRGEFTEPLNKIEEHLDKETYEACRDGIFLAIFAAKEDGFVEGFKCAFQLFAECVRE